ncbi:siderophore-interacting protein [Alcaligenaceae bacterium 429]|nr:siderophore-interacting protein [Alcaligenaceae bacterium 429]
MVRGWVFSARSGRTARGMGILLYSAVLGLSFLPQAAHAALEPGVSTPESFLFLQDIQQAARDLDYAGIVTYTQDGSTQAINVVHMVDGTGERERLELLDGTPREYLRHNDEVLCLVPERKLIVVEKRRPDRFPAILLGSVDNLPTYYSASVIDEVQRIAGRECRVYELHPKDTLRYGYRFCADVANSLLLQAETLNANGDVINQIAFANIAYGSRMPMSGLESAFNTDGWRTLNAYMEDIDLVSEGWAIPYPNGFEPVTQVVRSMRATRKVVQLVMSDGLAAISVFIEPVTNHGSYMKEDHGSSRGSMNLYRTQVAEYWVTATGEVPLSTLRDLAANVEYVPFNKKN